MRSLGLNDTFIQNTPPIDPAVVIDYGHVDGIPIGFCVHSNLAFLRHCPTLEWYAGFYRDLYWQEKSTPDRLALKDAQRKARSRVADITAVLTLPPAPDILDFGCGHGFGSALLVEYYGGRAFGIEPSDKARPVAAAQGVDIVGAGIDELGVRQFDLISLIQVLEHQPHPAETLATLARHLRPGGRFAVQVPDLDKLKSVSIPHCLCYSPRALWLLFAAIGFRVEAIHQPRNTNVTVIAGRDVEAVALPAAKSRVAFEELHARYAVPPLGQRLAIQGRRWRKLAYIHADRLRSRIAP